jgi:hypothetical protein
MAIRPVARDILSPVLLGLEEEGIPVEVREVAYGNAEELAKEGADGSRLNVGIGIHSADGLVVLHHRDLPAGRPLFVLDVKDPAPSRLRILGMNAARLVKGEPLVLFEEPQQPKEKREPPPSSPSIEMEMEEWVEVITRLVLESIALQKDMANSKQPSRR